MKSVKKTVRYIESPVETTRQVLQVVDDPSLWCRKDWKCQEAMEAMVMVVVMIFKLT